jgi:hypothetical protein
MTKTLFICWVTLLLVACQNKDRAANNCPLGEPTPIFYSDLSFVKRHTFEKTGQNSEEQVLFQDDLHLTIRQSGCEAIRQDYIFLLSPLPEADTQFWIEKSIELFGQLASYSANFYSFNQWAYKINEFKTEFRLTEAFEVAPSIYIKIDRILAAEETQLIITLLQQ